MSDSSEHTLAGPAVEVDADQNEQDVQALLREVADQIAPEVAADPKLVAEIVFELLMIGEHGRMCGSFAARSILQSLPEHHFLRKVAARAAHLHAGNNLTSGPPRLGDRLMRLAGE
jgi:hypothetical protein